MSVTLNIKTNVRANNYFPHRTQIGSTHRKIEKAELKILDPKKWLN